MRLGVAIVGFALLFLVILAGCIESSKELRVYAGAGLKKPMDTVIKEFEKKYGIKVIPNYGPSGGLYAQIVEGQPCDVYFAADWKYIEMLKEKGKITESRKFLKDFEVLVVSKTGDSKGIKSHEDLTKEGVVLAVADPKAPVGAYAERALKNLGIWEEIIEKDNLKARPSTANQLAIMVKNDEVDAALDYRSVATMYGLKYVEIFPHNLTGEIIFGIGIIKDGNKDLARKFVEFVLEHIDEFTKYGWEAYERS